MNFISYAQFMKDIEEFAKQLPRFDAVIGISRSGLIPATYLALHWNALLSSVNTVGMFERSPRIKNLEVESTLVIDDSYFTGKSMNAAREYLGNKVKYAALYPKNNNHNLDYYYKVVPYPRVFQWNVFHHIATRDGCFDMDGVLCRKPTQQENDYGPNYLKFLSSTKPLVIPTFELGEIITGRLEKYRPQTEAWLKRHNIKYGELFMRPGRSINIAAYKAECYMKSDCSLFFEDEPQQAFVIRYLSGKNVLCTTSWVMI